LTSLFKEDKNAITESNHGLFEGFIKDNGIGNFLDENYYNSIALEESGNTDLSALQAEELSLDLKMAQIVKNSYNDSKEYNHILKKDSFLIAGEGSEEREKY
jgi:hypothetical protein